MTKFQPITSELLSTYPSHVSNQKSWFAVQTRPRFEKKVALELQEKGIQSFLPLHTAKRQWSDRKQMVSLPLFPGYTFVRIVAGQDSRVAVLRLNGVLKFVGAKGIGVPIPDDEIAAVQTVLNRQIPFQPYPYLKVGQCVRIRGGCLEGVQGILTAVNGDQSLIVSIDLIQRSIAMRVTGYAIEAI